MLNIVQLFHFFYRLPLPGHRSHIAKDASNIEWKTEKNYIRKMEGPPESPHISGSARKGRYRNRMVRQTTANSISQDYQWVHNGLHGKMTLHNRRYQDFLPDRYTNHFDDDGDDLHYCEVLGQKTCARCLENTNRLMAAEYQNETFPGIRVSATDLIAPRLSKALSRRRLTEDHQGTGAGGAGGGAGAHLGGFATGESPPPYRKGSSLMRARSNVVISKDKMERSLRMLLKRDTMNMNKS